MYSAMRREQHSCIAIIWSCYERADACHNGRDRLCWRNAFEGGAGIGIEPVEGRIQFDRQGDLDHDRVAGGGGDGGGGGDTQSLD